MEKEELEKTKEIETIEDIVEVEAENEIDNEEEKDNETKTDEVREEVSEKDNTKSTNKKKKIVIIILIVMIILVVLIYFYLGWRKDKEKEKIKDDVYNEEKLSEKDKEEKIKIYGEKLEKVIASSYEKNKVILSYEEALKLVDSKDDINCKIHEVYEDLKIYLDECSLNGKKTTYSYGVKQEKGPVEVVDDNTKINVFISKKTGKASLDKPSDLKNYDVYVVDCGEVYQNASLFGDTQYVLYQNDEYYTQVKNYVTNKKVLENISYKAVLPFGNKNGYNTKYLAVLIDNKWGIYNIDTGKAVVAASFDGFSNGNSNSTMGPMSVIQPIKNNLVIAYKNNMYGVIDYTGGREVIPFTYTYINKIGDYLYACVKYGVDGVIYDLDGKEIIGSGYKNVYGITNGNYVLVNANDKILLITITGKLLFSFGEATDVESLNFMLEHEGELLFQFYKVGDKETCIEYSYNLNTKKGNIGAISCGGVGNSY